jgi:hypothetical protein
MSDSFGSGASDTDRRRPVEASTNEARGWISVEKRLPKRGSDVMAFWPPKAGPVHGGCFGIATFATPKHWHNPEDDEDDFIVPSHWMPLPPAPSGDSAEAAESSEQGPKT